MFGYILVTENKSVEVITKIAGYAEVVKIPVKWKIRFTKCYKAMKVSSIKHEEPYPSNVSQGYLQSWEYPTCPAKTVASCK